MASHHGDHPDGDGTLDRIFEALSHPVRRQILLAVKNEPPRDVNEFVSPSVIPTNVDTDTIEIQLHHQHLPFLDDAGFIDWDRDSSILYPGPRLEDANHFLALMEETHNDIT